MRQRCVEGGENVPVDIHCPENEHSNLEANDECLGKQNAEEHNGKDAGDVVYKIMKHHYHLQEQERKAANVAAQEAHPTMEDEKPSAVGGDQMIEETEAVGSPENLVAEPGHQDSANDYKNATERVAPSARVEDDKGRTGDHSRQSREGFSKESSMMKGQAGSAEAIESNKATVPTRKGDVQRVQVQGQQGEKQEERQSKVSSTDRASSQ